MQTSWMNSQGELQHQKFCRAVDVTVELQAKCLSKSVSWNLHTYWVTFTIFELMELTVSDHWYSHILNFEEHCANEQKYPLQQFCMGVYCFVPCTHTEQLLSTEHGRAGWVPGAKYSPAHSVLGMLNWLPQAKAAHLPPRMCLLNLRSAAVVPQRTAFRI